MPGLDWGKWRWWILPYSAFSGPWILRASSLLRFLNYLTFHTLLRLFAFCALSRTLSGSRAGIYRGNTVVLNLETRVLYSSLRDMHGPRCLPPAASLMVGLVASCCCTCTSGTCPRLHCFSKSHVTQVSPGCLRFIFQLSPFPECHPVCTKYRRTNWRWELARGRIMGEAAPRVISTISSEKTAFLGSERKYDTFLAGGVLCDLGRKNTPRKALSSLLLTLKQPLQLFKARRFTDAGTRFNYTEAS